MLRMLKSCVACANHKQAVTKPGSSLCMLTHISFLGNNRIGDPAQVVVVVPDVEEHGLGFVRVNLVALDDVLLVQECGQHALHVEVQPHLHCQALQHGLGGHSYVTSALGEG